MGPPRILFKLMVVVKLVQSKFNVAQWRKQSLLSFAGAIALEKNSPKARPKVFSKLYTMRNPISSSSSLQLYLSCSLHKQLRGGCLQRECSVCAPLPPSLDTNIMPTSCIATLRDLKMPFVLCISTLAPTHNCHGLQPLLTP